MNSDNTRNIELSNKIGDIHITDDVVASIAALAASETEGILPIAESAGIKNNTKGVHIRIEDDGVYAELFITVKYGFSIPKVTASVQEKVSNSIDVMTGLQVKAVDIHVTGVDIPQ